METVAKHRKHKAHLDIIRTSQFVQEVQDIIDEDPSKSIKTISRDLVHNLSHGPWRHPVKVLHDAQRSADVCTNSAPSHKAMMMQACMSMNLHDHITPNI